jgi:arsenate reductase-like glutaredoxin family protein
MQQEHPAPNSRAQRAPLTMEQLHAMLTKLQEQLSSTRNELQTTPNELNLAKTQLANTQAEFYRSLNPQSARLNEIDPQPLKAKDLSTDGLRTYKTTTLLLPTSKSLLSP